MGHLIPILVWALATWGLFRLDRGPKSRVSWELWIPTLWLFIGASRNLSEWMRGAPSRSPDAYLEGSPLDRALLSAILALGLIVLIRRGPRIGRLLRSNMPILLYFGYCGISAVWSDFPDVSFKRWFRAAGDVVMVLIVLSDRDWIDALRRLMARLGFLLVPLSILLIRYYPDFGRTYGKDGSPAWTGVSTDKNALGMLCLIFGLATLFCFIKIWQSDDPRKSRPLIAQGVLLGLTIYLLHESHSATALACFILAGGVMGLTSLFRWARKPAILHIMVWASLAVAVSSLFLGLGSSLVEGLGRNSTLTGRTSIWHYALLEVTNPVLGTGFESFWLGPRLARVAAGIHQGVNEAHNGYIEVYLNLGWVGLALLGGLIISGYRRIVPAVRRQTQDGSLRMAYWMVGIAYNFSEAGFKMMNPVWVLFLLSIAILPSTPNLRRARTSAQADIAPPAADQQAEVYNPTGPATVSSGLMTPR
jgi:exopolysaccharide production protein ExoQ